MRPELRHELLVVLLDPVLRCGGAGCGVRCPPLVTRRRRGGGATSKTSEDAGRNPQVAARLAGAFNPWTRYDNDRRRLMKSELERMASRMLSKDVSEIVGNALEMEKNKDSS